MYHTIIYFTPELALAFGLHNLLEIVMQQVVSAMEIHNIISTEGHFIRKKDL